MLRTGSGWVPDGDGDPGTGSCAGVRCSGWATLGCAAPAGAAGTSWATAGGGSGGRGRSGGVPSPDPGSGARTGSGEGSCGWGRPRHSDAHHPVAMP